MRTPASASASAACALLRAEFAPACLVSTMPADPSHAIWTASELAVCIGLVGPHHQLQDARPHPLADPGSDPCHPSPGAWGLHSLRMPAYT